MPWQMTSADDVAMTSLRADVSGGTLARDCDAETSGGAWGRVGGPMKTKFHRKGDRRDFFPMV